MKKKKNIVSTVIGGLIVCFILLFSDDFITPNEDTTPDVNNQNINSSLTEAIITPEYAMNQTTNNLEEIEYIDTIDGDTLSVLYQGEKKKIRLLMVDTPEMRHKEDGKQPYATEASVFTRNILNKAKKIEILFDVGPKTDNYDRLLVYVFVDGVLLQEELLKNGYAALRYMHKPNNTLEDEFREMEEVAKSQKLNIWKTEDYFQKDGFHPEVLN